MREYQPLSREVFRANFSSRCEPLPIIRSFAPQIWECTNLREHGTLRFMLPALRFALDPWVSFSREPLLILVLISLDELRLILQTSFTFLQNKLP